MWQPAARGLQIGLLATLITACGGGGAPVGDPNVIVDPPSPNIQLRGSVGDGPVSGATLDITTVTGRAITSVTSDATARYAVELQAQETDFPLLVSATGGTDMVTGAALDFELLSMTAAAGREQIVNVNPFSTLIVRTASMAPGGLTPANVARATSTVFAEAGFGLNPDRFADPIRTAVAPDNAAYMILAAESLAETVRRTHAALLGARPDLTAGDVLDAVAADLADSVLDGLGVAGSDVLVTAIFKVAAGQVLVEALANALRVNGVRATDSMDGAIAIVAPGPGVMLTGQVTADAAAIAQLLAALAAADVIMAGTVAAQLMAAANQIQPGMTTAQIAALIPAGAFGFFHTALALIPAVAPDSLARMAGGEPAANSPPLIGGTPATDVTQGQSYTFVPTASDADGDTLTFTIANRPAWAGFDATTGALTGTPGNNDVGVTDGIVIGVSDGQASAALNAFSLRVVASNNGPIISGTPAATVNQDEAYVFVPLASDPDGDALTFTIDNPPAWADFDPASGALTGTPGNDDVGLTADIVIGVSDGQAGAALPAFSLRVFNVNDPPSIGGNPATSVVQGQSYSFVPSASDPDGDPLVFSIDNPPPWANFDPQNGRLSGVPQARDVGQWPAIVISVSDGSESAALPSFALTVLAGATGSAELSWTAPTQNADTTPLIDLAGFRVYYSTTLGTYVDFVVLPDPAASSALLEELVPGTWYFVVTAYDSAGNESEFSELASKAIN